MKKTNAFLWELALLISLVGLAMAPTSAQAAVVDASYTDGTEVPLTAAGYTATGNTVNLTLNYAPVLGTKLMVVDNTSLNPIQGEFDNLANDASVDLSFGGVTYRFVAYYHGGKGNNDLVLLWRGTGLAAWGENGGGQLGNNSWTESQVPVAVDWSGVLSGKTIVAIAAGYHHNVTLCSDGTVVAWGRNVFGQVGDSSSTDRHVPVEVDASGVLSGTSFLASAGGVEHSVALVAATAEIVVEQPSGTEMTNAASVDFGATEFVGTVIDRSFIVRNTGFADLIDLSLSIGGINSSDFEIRENPNEVLSGGSSTSFAVRFAPNSSGAKAAILQISSSDADEDSFEVNLTGTASSLTTLTADYTTGEEVPLTAQAITATGRTGSFAATLGLAAPATRSAVKGVFLQDESNGSLIGLGLIKVPIDAPVRGSYQTSGVILSY